MRLKKGKWKYKIPRVGQLLRVTLLGEFPRELRMVDMAAFDALTAIARRTGDPLHACLATSNTLFVNPTPAKPGILRIAYYPPIKIA